MQFNLSKCEVLHRGHSNSRQPYYIGDYLLEAVSEEKDLGVIADDEPKFHSHTQAQAAKANRVLGLIKRTFTTWMLFVVTKVYKAIVCTHLDFGMMIASPHNKMDVKALESVQRRATKLITALQDKLFRERIVSLNLPTIVYIEGREEMQLPLANY